ncbi:MAG: hypothetical protein L0214_14075 [candidate division NC10 bacterium]|nr:hypothetical protein [candidate division NC10 bacterium]
MWYYKVVIGILLFPWSLILLMVVGSAGLRHARKARVIVLPPAALETAPVLPLALPEPALAAELAASSPDAS